MIQFLGIGLLIVGGVFCTVMAIDSKNEMDHEIREAMRYESNKERMRKAIEGK